MPYFYYRDGVLHRVPDGEQISISKYLPTNEHESIKYADALEIDIAKAKRGILTAKNYKIAKAYDKRFPSLILDQSELKHLWEEFLKKDAIQRGSPLVCMVLPWDNDYYRYTFINFGMSIKPIRKVFDDIPENVVDMFMEDYNRYGKK